MCKLSRLNSKSSRAVQTIKDNSLFVKGPQLFNSLPMNVRKKDNCTVDQFKAELDRYLKNVPDEPRVPRYTHGTNNTLLNYR